MGIKGADERRLKVEVEGMPDILECPHLNKRFFMHGQESVVTRGRVGVVLTP